MLNRFAAVVATVTLFAGLSARGAEPAASKPVEVRVDAAVRRALEEPIDRLEIKEALLPHAVDTIKAKLGVNIVIDSRALAQARVPDDLRVTLSAQKITLEQALALISRGRGMNADLGCYAVGPNIVITTREIAASRTLTQAYDIADLVKAVVDAMRTPTGNPAAAPVFSSSTPDDLASLNARAAQSLMNVVAATIEPADWHTIGEARGTGAIGTLSYFGGKLVVRHNIHVQRAVADLISQLREKKVALPKE